MSTARTVLLALTSLAVLVAVVATPAAAAEQWSLAGDVNVGDPTLRIVYDTNYPGARTRALSLTSQLQGRFASYGYAQPGVISGLTEIGYSDHIAGVQIQLYGDPAEPGTNDFYLGSLSDALAPYGFTMYGCWETYPSVCPGWDNQFR